MKSITRRISFVVCFFLLLKCQCIIGFNFLRSNPIFNTLIDKPRFPLAPPLQFITLDEVPLVEAAQAEDNSVYVITEASHSDLPALVSLRTDVFYPDLVDIKSFHSKVLEKLRSRREEGSVCLIVTRGDKQSTNLQWDYSPDVVGTVEFSSTDFKHTPLEALGRENKLYLMDLAVRKDSRQRGIASTLLKLAEKYAIKNGYDQILLHVEVGNTKALQLYTRHGYEELPPSKASIQFTENRLHKPSSCYVFLRKHIESTFDLEGCTS